MEPGESGRGLPQSKTWRKFRAGRRTRSVLDCASPLALWDGVWKVIGMWKSARNKQLAWFICIAVFNTIGILPIVYLTLCQKDRNQG